MKLNFFFDIDGTLVPFGGGVPKSTVEAISRAKALGHRMILSTGRAPHEILDAVYDLPLDGGVFSAGANLIADGKLFFRAEANEKQRKLFFDVADKYGLLWLIQGEFKSFCTEKTVQVYNKLSMSANGKLVYLKNLEIVERFPEDEPISKIYIMSEDGLALKAREELEGPFHCVNNTTGVPEENAAEVMLQGASKSTGIKRMLEHFGDGLESAVGVGDGENDLDMIDVCGLGIAMGNSCQVLKDHADYVTDHIDNDGLAKAIYYAMDNLK